MPVQKFRSVEEMPRLGRAADEELAARIRAVWNRALVFAPPDRRARGVMKFRTIEEANAAREEATRERMRASR